MSAEPKGTINQCPTCKGLAAVTATPCCKSVQCTWNRCTCGYTYDRVTGKHFKTGIGIKDAT